MSGHAANIVREKSDEEIVNLCVEALAKMFPEQVWDEFLEMVWFYYDQSYLWGYKVTDLVIMSYRIFSLVSQSHYVVVSLVTVIC